ncbi:MAG: 30S ribosomal protein S18 [bacterium]|jgi:small subunit ribosomal protein S18
MKPSSTRPRRKKRIMRVKVCRFCENRIKVMDFKDADMLRRFQTEKGRILPRRITGTCFVHQKMLAQAVKRARELALVL